MRKISLAFAVALSLAAFGCNKADGGADCTKAIDHSIELSKAAMEKQGIAPALLVKMKDLSVRHCNDDKWSADATRCMIDAKTEKESGPCYAKLSPEQQEKMNKAAMELMRSNMPAPAPPPAPTPPAADTGSAGSAVAPK